jgi:hypothetical protein
MLYDLFICHASEDKDSFVQPLAEALREEHIEVWYDEFTLKLGDNIRRTIDNGLMQSRFGIIVLSQAFFNKKWPTYELDGLTQIEMRGSDKVLLPIWHGVDYNDVFTYSPSLANRKAISSEEGLDKVLKAIDRVIKPQGSPLVEARDLLLRWGITPPVITDPYWLDVVEASNRDEAYGAVPADEAVWGRWTFPLPSKEGSSQQWGKRLAWTAMQMDWTQNAEVNKISPLTPHEEVLSFIASQPGLFETCECYPDLLIEYAPQLTIPGFSGDFETLFNKLYEKSISDSNKVGGNHQCDEEWMLRHPNFGGYDPSNVASMYFLAGMFGPPVSPYEHVDHMVWLLSKNSEWLPKKIHQMLIEGLADWGVWFWPHGHSQSTTYLYEAMLDSAHGKAFRWTRAIRSETIYNLSLSIHLLQLPETAEEIFKHFVKENFVGKWIQSSKERWAQKQNTE